MYCTSKEFLDLLQEYVDKIVEISNGALVFVEYISLPYFGTAILRFDLTAGDYTLADLDSYEALMQDVVKDAFLVDFMGSVYQTLGLKPEEYENCFKKCYHRYKDIPIVFGTCQEKLKNDAALLLSKCGLSPDLKVWEIQIDDVIALYILADADQRIGTYTFENNTIHVYEVAEEVCIGLMKAITYAKKQHMSLLHALLDLKNEITE